MAQPFLATRIRFLFQGFAFDLELNDSSVQFIDIFWLTIDSHAQSCCCFINQIDCLIRKEAISNVAVRKSGCCNNCTIRDTYAMVEFIFFFQTAQDRDGIRDRWFGNEDRLETSCQSCVFFYMVAVLIQGCCPDAV